MRISNHVLVIATLVVALAAGCSSRGSEPLGSADGGATTTPEVGVVSIEQSVGLPVTPADLGEPDWNDEIDLELTWVQDVATIRRSAVCGDECASTRNLELRDLPGELPQFVSLTVTESDFESQESFSIDNGRLEIDQWSREGPISGRFFDESGAQQLVFWFDPFTVQASVGQLSNDTLREGLTSGDPTERIAALRAIVDSPAERSPLLDEMIALLGDTAEVPHLYEQSWPYWDAAGPQQVIGEHASIALHEVLNFPSGPGINFMTPPEVWVAIDWADLDEGVALPSRIEQVSDNWRTFAALSTAPTDKPAPLAGLYRYLPEECGENDTASGSPDGDARVCAALAYLLCDGSAVWNVGPTLLSGSWSIDDGVGTISDSDGARLKRRVGPDHGPIDTGSLTRTQFNGLQCEPG